MKSQASRLGALEVVEGQGRLIVAKLREQDSLDALLSASGITPRPDDLIVRLDRPDGVGEDFIRVTEGAA